ncbi:hypothetical protein BV20DRAFT_943721 [Pilatotrama ljubarskyi]|nr:hypothetical protein BV20DRAFT_943721 [Pilatotrama ljubarskyi]
MFSKTFAVAAVVLGATLQAAAHAGITPALGVSTTFIRANVQRPSAAAPCGAIDIASNFDSSTPIIANPDGTFDATITNFNAGVDGSRMVVNATVDPTGTGASFSGIATVLVNGLLDPTDVTSQPLVVQLPQGTTCSGGATADKCLVSFITAGGFGNCVVVETPATA